LTFGSIGIEEHHDASQSPSQPHRNVPLICADGSDLADLCVGMSAILTIDTGRQRSLSGLWSDLTTWAQSWFDPPPAAAKAAATR